VETVQLSFHVEFRFRGERGEVEGDGKVKVAEVEFGASEVEDDDGREGIDRELAVILKS
jgi:hypothetical protein